MSVSDSYLASTTGGVVGAMVSNLIFGFGFESMISLGLLGAVSGFTGARLSDAFTEDVAGDAPLRNFIGLVLGGAAGSLSLDSLVPPELRLKGR